MATIPSENTRMATQDQVGKKWEARAARIRKMMTKNMVESSVSKPVVFPGACISDGIGAAEQF